MCDTSHMLRGTLFLAPSQQQTPRELQLAASNALATLARGHFNPVMTVLQRQLKPFGQPDEFTLLTLGKMAANNGKKDRVLHPMLS